MVVFLTSILNTLGNQERGDQCKVYDPDLVTQMVHYFFHHPFFISTNDLLFLFYYFIFAEFILPGIQ